MIRCDNDRNKGQGDPRLMQLFNNFIGDFTLTEICVSSAKFTWSNKQKDPTLIKLDRFLVTSQWELHFSRCFAWSKARIRSDHCPLILNTGEHGAVRPQIFFF